MKYKNYRNVLKGVSTLDIMKKNLKAVLFLIILTVLSANVFGGHSTLDLVDPNFNPQIQTNSYGFKWVNRLYSLPDGKILALGGFNYYNGVPVGKLIRLNPDGSLDTTFNNQTVTAALSNQSLSQIIVQSDGKIILKCDGLVAGGQSARRMLRLNPDGTLDPTFNFTRDESIFRANIDSLDRLVLMGTFTTPQGTRRLIRINTDGSLDTSFDFPVNDNSFQYMSVQGNKVIVSTQMSGSGTSRIYRLNEDGSEDSTFTPLTGAVGLLEVQPTNNKVLYFNGGSLLRSNVNGGNDNTFQPTTFQGSSGELLKFTLDGKMVTAFSSSPTTFRRYLANGGVDPSFNPYTTINVASFTIQPDDRIVIGDGQMGGTTPGSSSNNFSRLNPNGELDPTFNPGGTGFQNIVPGIIAAIDAQPDGKIMIGGKFDLVNGTARSKLARLNVDGTIDQTFQVNTTSGTGNYFSLIREIYQIKVQADGKIVVVGWFDYVFNSVAKINLVRLNSDGSIDPTFALNYRLFDYSQINFGGQNRFAPYGDGRLMVGSSRTSTPGEVYGPVRINADGMRDTGFISMLNNTVDTVYIQDVALQPDGKVVVSGQYSSPTIATKSFVARLNSNGSMDSTFQYTEETGLLKSRLALLPSGKILIIKSFNPNGGGAKIQRLNPDGSLDNTFNNLISFDNSAKLNAILALPNGKIFVGGKFTIPINGQTGKNLLQLNENGDFADTVYNLNEEVFSLAVDGEGRVLVGGGFTVIGTNSGGSETRSFTARLTDSTARFDFDGDGRSDYGVFDGVSGDWSILSSQSGQTTNPHFGLNGDKTAVADYDGDGKDDLAVYRPSEGIWYILRSRDGFQAIRWGAVEDIPVAGDYDGDGKSDIAVWRPADGVWWIYQSGNNQPLVIRFGLTGDMPLPDADFDGDGKTDIAVWRPSDGNFYWLASASNNEFKIVHFGAEGDIPSVGDFNGDGKTDLVVYRPTEGTWYQYLTTPNGYQFAAVNFGLNGDEPVAADYDGDGKTDIALRRGNDWYVLNSTQGYNLRTFGDAEHIAVASLANR